MANRPVEAGHHVRPSWHVAAVVVVAIVACIAGIGNDLAQDDIYLIRDNSTVQSLGNIGAMFGSPFWPPPLTCEPAILPACECEGEGGGRF